jgi:two-component system, chemotaxis family, chemotaxis protein CheY
VISSQAGILVVDRVALVRQQISSIFSVEGIKKVTGLSSPEEALKLLETKPCHLIVTELHFPSLGTLEFLKKVRAHPFPRVSGIGFVILTADSTKECVDAMMAAGADDYILKPLTPKCVQSRIFSLLMKLSADA